MFKFNDISTEEMNIVVEEEENLIGRAPQRYESNEIEGRDGFVFEDLGYSSFERNLKLQLLDISKLDIILAWLNGDGILEYKDRITTAKFAEGLNLQRAANIKTIDIKLIRGPFWYKKTDDYITVIDNVENEGNVYSRPIIRLEKNTSDKVDIEIGGIRFVYNFEEDNYVEIDCEDKNALMSGLLRNRQLKIGFDFPKLYPGNNNRIVIYSGDAVIKVKRKDRWL